MDFMRESARRTDGMRCGMMGMHAGFTLSDRTLEACIEALPATSGCHLHVAECLEDTAHSLKTYGKSVVRRLRERGVLGRKTLAAHCIHPQLGGRAAPARDGHHGGALPAQQHGRRGRGPRAWSSTPARA